MEEGEFADATKTEAITAPPWCKSTGRRSHSISASQDGIESAKRLDGSLRCLFALYRVSRTPPEGVAARAGEARPRRRTDWSESKGRTCSRKPCAPACASHCVFVAQGAEQLLDALAHLPPETEVLLVPRELLDPALWPPKRRSRSPRWSSRRTGPGRTCSATDRKTAPLVVVLAGLQDPGNLGTICAPPRPLAPTASSACPEP